MQKPAAPNTNIRPIRRMPCAPRLPPATPISGNRPTTVPMTKSAALEPPVRSCRRCAHQLRMPPVAVMATITATRTPITQSRRGMRRRRTPGRSSRSPPIRRVWIVYSGPEPAPRSGSGGVTVMPASSLTGRRSRRCGDEVDERLDRAEQPRVEVGVGAHAAADASPRVGHVSRTEMPGDGLLPRQRPGDVRPRGEADAVRLHGLPDVDERMAHDEDVRAANLFGDPALLGPRDEVVEQHAEPGVRSRAEGAHDVGKVVGALELLHDHTLDAQVVAP